MSLQIKKKKNWFFLEPKSMLLENHKLLRMTYNDISEFFGLVPGAWGPLKCLLKEKRVASPKYTAIIKRSDEWNLKWPASLSFGRPVIIDIYIINAFTVEPKYLCCPDWKHSQSFRNSFGRNYLWLNIYICSTLTKNKNKHLKERKKKNMSINKLSSK